MKNRKRASTPNIVAALLAALLATLPCLSAFAEEEAGRIVENEWNYVDASMDVSGGIPQDATGRLARIRAAGKLTVATSPYYPPQEFIDETLTGQARFVGADMDLARRIAERMGVELEIVPMSFADVLSAVSDGQYDLAVSAVSFTQERAVVLEMSKGYYYTDEQASTGLIIRAEDADSIRGVEDLAERDIAAQSGSLQESMAADSIDFYHKFRRLPTPNDVYDAVASGAVDTGVVDLENAKAYIENNPDCGLTIVLDVFFELQPQYKGDRVASAKGETELIGFVNGVIDELLESGEYDLWFEQYAHSEAGQD